MNRRVALTVTVNTGNISFTFYCMFPICFRSPLWCIWSPFCDLLNFCLSVSISVSMTVWEPGEYLSFSHFSLNLELFFSHSSSLFPLLWILGTRGSKFWSNFHKTCILTHWALSKVIPLNSERASTQSPQLLSGIPSQSSLGLGHQNHWPKLRLVLVLPLAQGFYFSNAYTLNILEGFVAHSETQTDMGFYKEIVPTQQKQGNLQGNIWDFPTHQFEIASIGKMNIYLFLP